jgi:type IV fimbrial biogenesis protein FimT
MPKMHQPSPAPITFPRRRCVRGVTLIEMMVALAIVAILAVIAAPSLTLFVERNRMNAEISAFSSALRLAQSAARNGRLHTICPSNNPDAANPTCAQGNGPTGWATGWIVFSDGNVLGQVDGVDVVIARQSAFNASGGIMSNGNTPFITYRQSGLAVGAAATFTFRLKSDPTNVDAQRTVTINFQGASTIQR